MSQCVSLVFAAGFVGLAAIAQAQEDFALQSIPTASGFELRWPTGAASGGAEPAFELQSSADCAQWNTLATNIIGTNGWASCQIINTPETVFFRVKNAQPLALTGDGGAEVFGYARTLSQKLARLDWITPGQFAATFPSGADYLPQIDFDPTTAAYWDAVDEEITWPGWPPLKTFQLNEAEKTVLQKNGFVASGRLGAKSFVELYYGVFHRDLPVLITTDSILHAWHRTYDAILEDLELGYLKISLGDFLNSLSGQIPALSHIYGPGPMRQSILDADYYVAVARSLLAGGLVSSKMWQDARVTETLAKIAEGKSVRFNLFGRLDRDPDYIFDFSQFKPRGHYAKSALLARYFQTMMWCGRVDFRVAGNPNYASARELGTALILLQACQNARQMAAWQEFDQVLQVMVGPVDSMNLPQLQALFQASNLKSFDNLKSYADLEAMQASITSGDLGFQQITSDYYFSPLSTKQLKLPRSFTIFGQRFTQDSWAMGKVVYDQIRWPSSEGMEKVQRRIPSGLDVAFAVMANDQTVPDLVARMQNPQGRAFRDGLPYQRNLAAVRQTLDSQGDSAWTNNLYNGWLNALRQLSPPTTDPAFPQCMRTRAWAMKTLNTQLASWTELRHDTVLYVKQSYTPGTSCSYPVAYVEPVPAFWRQMGALASQAKDLLAGLDLFSNTNLLGEAPYEDGYGQGVVFTMNISQRRSGMVTCLERFASTIATLEQLSEKELRQESFNTNEVAFLKDIVEKTIGYFGNESFNGWYPRLYYRDNEGFDIPSRDLAVRLGLMLMPYDSAKWDAIVTDVHTDSPDEIAGDPGMVLHEGTGGVSCLVAAIDSGPDRCLYLGPAFTHYEFEKPIDKRLTDEEWKDQLTNGQVPETPPWTHDFYLP